MCAGHQTTVHITVHVCWSAVERGRGGQRALGLYRRDGEGVELVERLGVGLRHLCKAQGDELVRAIML